MTGEVDLRPRSHVGTLIATAIAVGSAVWGATQWLGTRAGADDVKKLTHDSFQHRLELETMKGEVKAINIRLDEGFRSLNAKLDRDERKRR